MKIEFDAGKDAINLRKHGISLTRTTDFDFDSAYFDLNDGEDHDELRWNAVGFLDARLYSLTFTERSGAIRAISLRKATKKESKKYEQEK